MFLQPCNQWTAIVSKACEIIKQTLGFEPISYCYSWYKITQFVPAISLSISWYIFLYLFTIILLSKRETILFRPFFLMISISFHSTIGSRLWKTLPCQKAVPAIPYFHAQSYRVAPMSNGKTGKPQFMPFKYYIWADSAIPKLGDHNVINTWTHLYQKQ